jgi:spore coat protein U-like protein
MKKSVNKSRLAAVGILLATGSQIASAATTTTTFTVSATVTNNCTVSATNHAFGAYTPSAVPPTDATSTLTVNCTVGAGYNVGLDAGTGSGATVTTRKMTSGANTLNYSLYQDALRSTVWGNTVGTDTVAGIGTGLNVGHTVYGRIPASQNVAAGSYSDTITVTVTF